MMKQLFTIIFFILNISISYSQISWYDSSDNLFNTVYEVEDMYPLEIKTYNSYINEGYSNEYALVAINAGRAQHNLINAPAIIISYTANQITPRDSFPGCEGAVGVWVELINTSPKTIKEITLQFNFFNYDSQVYDVKTGDEFCILKFQNLKGRTKSMKYQEVTERILDCQHFLTLNDASYKKLFYNKKANKISIVDALVVYNDGTKTNRISVFDLHGNKGLIADGPLRPFFEILNKQEKQSSNSVYSDKSNTNIRPNDGIDVISANNEVVIVDGNSEDLPPIIKKPIDNSPIFKSAEVMPEFPGGEAALIKYINSHIQYPAAAEENNIQGRVIVQMVIEKDGSVGRVQVIRSVDRSLDNEAIRVVKSLPKFFPGKQNNQPVRAWYTMPITFKLQNNG